MSDFAGAIEVRPAPAKRRALSHRTRKMPGHQLIGIARSPHVARPAGASCECVKYVHCPEQFFPGGWFHFENMNFIALTDIWRTLTTLERMGSLIAATQRRRGNYPKIKQFGGEGGIRTPDTVAPHRLRHRV
jgi:hypothetical protein